jgi:hypothetical protein
MKFKRGPPRKGSKMDWKEEIAEILKVRYQGDPRQPHEVLTAAMWVMVKEIERRLPVEKEATSGCDHIYGIRHNNHLGFSAIMVHGRSPTPPDKYFPFCPLCGERLK